MRGVVGKRTRRGCHACPRAATRNSGAAPALEPRRVDAAAVPGNLPAMTALATSHALPAVGVEFPFAELYERLPLA